MKRLSMRGLSGWWANRAIALPAGVSLIVLIALLDWKVQPNLSLGFLYLVPILWLAAFLKRWELAFIALDCGLLREAFSPWGWSTDSTWRVTLSSAVFFGAAMAVSELVRNRRLIMQQIREIETQNRLRSEAEEQLRVLVETSPAAILTLDSEGKVLSANESAHRLLGFVEQRLEGESIEEYLPILASVPELTHEQRYFRTMLEERGRRRDGGAFLAEVWFSTFQTSAGPRVAAIVMDASEQLRDREGRGLESALTTSRVLLGAVSHEVRNLAAAATMACTSLSRVSALSENEDLKALVALVESMRKIASHELRHALECAPSADLSAVLDDLRIILEPSFHEDEIELLWDCREALPVVRGDHHGLLQVFMNLAQNSQRALQQSEQKRLLIAAGIENGRVVVRFQDTGCGVPFPDRLFQPMQDGADVHGLGLFVSRSMVRSFGGTIHYEPQPSGSCFAVELAAAPAEETETR
jgi:two-component system sensor kinase FixL